MNDLPQWIIDAQQAYGHLPQQQESETNRLMVSLGHPKAEAYRRARNHFDQLVYAASTYHRFYSVADSDNYSMISPPDLMIIEDGTQTTIEERAHAHRMHGWRYTPLYRLHCGGWYISTTNPKLAKDFQSNTEGKVVELPDGHYILHLEIATPDTFEWIAGLLDCYQYDCYHTLRGKAPAPDSAVAIEGILCRIGGYMQELPDAWL